MKRLALCLVAMLAVLPAPRAGAGSSDALTSVRAEAPSWWTPALRERVHAAGPAGVPLPPEVEAQIPASSLAFLGIRPGQLILVDNVRDGATSLCTSNFVFTSGSNTTPKRGKKSGSTAASESNQFIGTAGHCGSVGDPVTMLFAPLGLVEIGTIVRSTGAPDDISRLDFALISIDAALTQYVSPSMAHWGGPTGVFTGDGVQPVQHTGWGLGVGAGGTPRAGVAYEWNRGTEWRFEGVIAPGDSGSGAIVAGGLAAGNITHIAVNSRDVPPAWHGGSTITAILSYLGSYSLATCTLPVPWPLPGCP